MKHSTPHFKNYASLASPVVAATEDPKGDGRHAIGFYVGGAGNLVVRPRGGSGSTDQTITCIAGGPPLLVEFDSIRSGTATNVVVLWER